MSASPDTAGLYPRFRSKIDPSLGGAILIGILINVAAAVGLLFQPGVAAFAILPLLAAGLAFWMVADTWYGVTNTDLIVHCGPFRTAVPVASIRAVRPIRTVLSAPALSLSLDRLEIVHAGGTTVISPADKAGFLRALRERQVSVEEMPPLEARSLAASQKRLLQWALPIILAVSLSVTGYAVLGGNTPLQVEVTAEAVTVHGAWGTTVPRADITSLSLVDTLPHVRRTLGYGLGTTMRGRATSRDLGEHGHAYISRASPPFIVVQTKQHGFLVLNMDESASTRRLFEDLQSKAGPR